MRASVDQRRTDKQLQPAAKKGARVGRPCLPSCAWLLCAPRPSQILHRPPPLPFCHARLARARQRRRRQEAAAPRTSCCSPPSSAGAHSACSSNSWAPAASAADLAAPAASTPAGALSSAHRACQRASKGAAIAPLARVPADPAPARRAARRGCAPRLLALARVRAQAALHEPSAGRGRRLPRQPNLSPPSSPNADSVFPKGVPRRNGPGRPRAPSCPAGKGFFLVVVFLPV